MVKEGRVSIGEEKQEGKGCGWVLVTIYNLQLCLMIVFSKGTEQIKPLVKGKSGECS